MTSRGSLLNWVARIGAVVVVVVGSAVIFGTLSNNTRLQSVLPGLATMKANTAFCFLAAGVALVLLCTRAPESRSRRLARALSVFVTALGGLTLAEDLLEFDFGIDQLILPAASQVPNSLHPGRMAPATAFNFFVMGCALLALKARQARLAVCAHWLVIPVLFVSTLAVVGYAYGVSSLYAMKPFASMALHTAGTFIILSLSLLAADSAHGFANIASSDTAGGVVSRRLLPTIPLILFLLGWAGLAGQKAGLYDTPFCLALMVLLSMTVCAVTVASTAVTLHKIDVTRNRAEAEIITLNAELERRVQERTQHLAQMSVELSAANTALEQLSLQDGLTGLANRRFFDRYLADQIAVARRQKRTLALVLCDIDSFKAYNDDYGHQAGDECLKQIAVALRSCCSRPADLAARYGGEEFAMILPDTELIDAARIAEASRDAVARLRIPHVHSPATSHISISGGVAVLFAAIDPTADQLITAADQLLYRAKALGRNRMVSMQTGQESEYAEAKC
jgi:diguanylate cyclase (GGDEF)-like protein